MKLFYTLFFTLITFIAGAQTFFHTGSTDDVNTNPLPGIVLAGGATDNNDAMRWFLQRADGGDIVVIRASGGDGYNSYLYSSLNVTVNSVTSIVIPNRTAANNQEVYDAIVNAEALFIAGGNQWDYVNYWKNTLVHDAIQYLIDEKGVTVGGTSAGLAVLGAVVYTAENNTVWSTEALNNPYHFRVTLDNDFLQIPFLQDVVTDSHYNRVQGDDEDRKGRHVAFLARMVTDWDMDAKGIGVNEYTAVGVDENGLARVFGNPSYDDFAYFLKVNAGAPEVCVSGTPLTWNHGGQALSVYKILGNPQGNNLFDLNDWQTAGGGEWQSWYVVSGQLFEAQAGGVFSVHFSVKHGITEAPIQGASIQLEGFAPQTTTSSGVAVFSGVEGGSQLAYTVTHTGYLTEEGSVSVVNENVQETILLYPGSGTPVNEQKAYEGFKVFPNPIAEGTLNIDFPREIATRKLVVINALGVVVYSRELANEHTSIKPISVDQFSPGFYFIRIETSDQVFSTRFLKQ
jgi:cyanophycinase-like exopeptidase